MALAVSVPNQCESEALGSKVFVFSSTTFACSLEWNVRGGVHRFSCCVLLCAFMARWKESIPSSPDTIPNANCCDGPMDQSLEAARSIQPSKFALHFIPGSLLKLIGQGRVVLLHVGQKFLKVGNIVGGRRSHGPHLVDVPKDSLDSFSKLRKSSEECTCLRVSIFSSFSS